MTRSFETSLHSIPLMKSDEVRHHCVRRSDHILRFAVDRVSAFGMAMNAQTSGTSGSPTRLALFNSKGLVHICLKHVTGNASEGMAARTKSVRLKVGRSSSGGSHRNPRKPSYENLLPDWAGRTIGPAARCSVYKFLLPSTSE